MYSRPQRTISIPHVELRSPPLWKCGWWSRDITIFTPPVLQILVFHLALLLQPWCPSAWTLRRTFGLHSAARRLSLRPCHILGWCWERRSMWGKWTQHDTMIQVKPFLQANQVSHPHGVPGIFLDFCAEQNNLLESVPSRCGAGCICWSSEGLIASWALTVGRSLLLRFPAT